MKGLGFVIGGTVNFQLMTNKLSEKDYDGCKAHIWLKMLNDGQMPIKWRKSNSKGTSVEFGMIDSQEKLDKAKAEFKGFLTKINTLHGFDFEIDDSEHK
jgi:hypothetical protein